jgi:hypothetical protein
MPASVLAAGFSSAPSSMNSFGSSGFSSNSLDTNSYFQPSFGAYVEEIIIYLIIYFIF